MSFVPYVVEQTAKEHGIAFKAIHIERKEDAQNSPTPITTYALFCDGNYVTNEQMNDAKFLKLAFREAGYNQKTQRITTKNIFMKATLFGCFSFADGLQ